MKRRYDVYRRHKRNIDYDKKRRNKYNIKYNAFNTDYIHYWIDNKNN